MHDQHGAISRRELLLGSMAAGGLTALGLPAVSLAAADAGGGVSSAKLDQLAGLIRGELITPTSAGYEDARKVWNGMIDRHPAAIARCTGVADIMDVIRFCRENDIPATVRGGGHNVAGKAVRDGAITIDLAPMQGIRVDPVNKQARAQGGVRWGAFDRETLAMNLATTGGTVGSTGIAGLTLGGGLGWLMRKHGLSCDNVVGADVVTADGRFLTANKDQNEDLFWALRGGGGNFGVVTAFDYQLHDAEPIYGGMALYPENMARDLLYFFRDYTESAPDSVTAMAGIMVGPPGTPVEGQRAGWIGICHSGPLDEGERLVRPFKVFGPPAADFIGPTTYAGIQGLFEAAGAPGARNYWRSSFMKELSDDVIDLLVARAGEMPEPGSLALVEHMGGAIARMGEHETAFANRGANYNVSMLSMWLDAAQDERNVAWTRSLGDELRSHSTGGAYVNYMAGDEDPDTVKAWYDANFERLVEVKRKYDPTNFFSSNHNIAP